MKVLTVVGARPQFIKARPVSAVLRADHEEVLVHTGQHYDEALSAVFFEELGLAEPDYHLGVGSDSHGRQTAAMMTGIEDVLEREAPDCVLAYGDTNSTLAAALVATKADTTLAHVEAGLRCDVRSMPEEINRRLTDHGADLLFAPTERAVANLRREGLTENVHHVGDVTHDSIRWARERASARSTILEDLGLEAGRFVLATVHRAANTDDPDRLAAILDGLAGASDPVVFPAHPRTVDRLRALGYWEAANRRLEVIDPLGYLDFVTLTAAAGVVATDSGGVQKEAFLLDTPCVTLREETEWPETVESGWNVLVGADPTAIRDALSRRDPPAEKPRPFGDGRAAERIVEVLTDA